MHPDRTKKRHDFLARHDLGSIHVEGLAADASFRRYFRLTGQDTAMLLMDAPPPQEDIEPFVRLAEHLQSLGLRTPKIYAKDRESGFVLLEDFGDSTFTALLKRQSDEETEFRLYRLAIDVLLKLHHHPRCRQVAVPSYDHESLLNETALFSQWYLPSVSGDATPHDATKEWRQAWQSSLNRLPELPDTLVLRDFHVDNLMIVGSPNAADKSMSSEHCGLLDFQDAVIGSPAYDLVSLLEDARRDVSASVQKLAFDYYVANAKILKNDSDVEIFRRHYRLLGAQRHAKVAGIFVRLAARDGKQNYLHHLPRVLRLFERSIATATDEHGDFTELREWLNRRVYDQLQDGLSLNNSSDTSTVKGQDQPNTWSSRNKTQVHPELECKLPIPDSEFIATFSAKVQQAPK